MLEGFSLYSVIDYATKIFSFIMIIGGIYVFYSPQNKLNRIERYFAVKIRNAIQNSMKERIERRISSILSVVSNAYYGPNVVIHETKPITGKSLYFSLMMTFFIYLLYHLQ